MTTWRTAENWRIWRRVQEHQPCESCGKVLIVVELSPRRTPEDREKPADVELALWESIRNPDAFDEPTPGEHTPERCREVRDRAATAP